MKILLVGGTGLISSVVTRLLVERGDDVVLYNRARTAATLPVGVGCIAGDRRDARAFEQQMLQLHGVDCVIDMVCFRPEEAASSVRAFGGRIGQLVLCSTVDVYSRPPAAVPICEDAARSPDPDFEYGRDKATCERILEQAAGDGAFGLTILRPAHTYGEGRGLPDSFGPSTVYLDRLRKGRPIVVHGDGSALRVSCHRDDAARAFVGAAGNPLSVGKAYNVAGEEWLSWNQYHHIVAAAMGAPAPALVHIPVEQLRMLDPERAQPAVYKYQFNGIYDTAATRSDLGFSYTIPLATGVGRIVAWLDEHGGLDDCDADPFQDRLIDAWRSAPADFTPQLVRNARARRHRKGGNAPASKSSPERRLAEQ